KIKNQIEKILHLGDILISFGDFLENNAQLVPTGYVEEIWIEELREKLSKYEPEKDESPFVEFLTKIPSFDEAITLSLNFLMPLHPKYLYFWDLISIKELKEILQPLEIGESSILYSKNQKHILEKLGVPHESSSDSILLKETEAKIFYNLLFRKPIKIDDSKSVTKIISETSGIKISPKHSTSVGVRIGRPEKAAPRQMKPPVHILFPIGDKGGPTRDLLKASHNEKFFTNIHNRFCNTCNELSISIICQKCKSKTSIIYNCRICRAKLDSSFCPKCKKEASSHSYQLFPLKNKLLMAQEKIGIRANEPFKGVKELINQEKIAEPLEKGLIRQSLGLTVFKDGTVRFDATNSPLTHFKPSWIGTSIEKLKELGYTHDAKEIPLTSTDQIIELRMQDVIIPYESAKYLINVCKYIDIELEKFYGKTAFYNVKNIDDLVGHLILGLAPHTSVGIVGRIIGFAETNVCFATP
ncbi:MAG: DNA polymerase II large subunit, partial [Nitrosopumilaceae archaeon]